MELSQSFCALIRTITGIEQRCAEAFGAGSDAQSLARADGFKRMVEAAGQRWPETWRVTAGVERPRTI